MTYLVWQILNYSGIWEFIIKVKAIIIVQINKILCFVGTYVGNFAPPR